MFPKLGIETLWIEYGTADHLKLIPIHDIRLKVGSSRCDGLLFFHALTGCDSTTSFSGFSKVSAWNLRNGLPDVVTALFKKLSIFNPSNDIDNDDMILIENFVSALFQRMHTLPNTSINETRKKLFLTKGMSLDKLPLQEMYFILKPKEVFFNRSLGVSH